MPSRIPSTLNSNNRIKVAIALIAATTLILGCSQQQQAPVGPVVNATAAAAAAISLYDGNDDGTLSKEELASCPALFSDMKKLDEDGNDVISQLEIERRLDELLNNGTVLVDAIAEVSLGNQPLSDATVTLVPEPFMGESYKAVTAVTNSSGLVAFTGHNPKLPGVYLGLYRVRVSKQKNGKEIIAKKYNIDSELGLELAAGKSNITQFLVETL